MNVSTPLVLSGSALESGDIGRKCAEKGIVPDYKKPKEQRETRDKRHSNKDRRGGRDNQGNRDRHNGRGGRGAD